MTGLPQSGMLMFAADAVVLAPLGEELLFRGVLLSWLERLFSSPTALWISAILFAVQHLAYGPGIASVVVTGLALGWTRQRSGGLAAPLFIHTAFNGASLLLRTFLAWRPHPHRMPCI